VLTFEKQFDDISDYQKNEEEYENYEDQNDVDIYYQTEDKHVARNGKNGSHARELNSQ
jgi:hypothetical protein